MALDKDLVKEFKAATESFNDAIETLNSDFLPRFDRSLELFERNTESIFKQYFSQFTEDLRTTFDNLQNVSLKVEDNYLDSLNVLNDSINSLTIETEVLRNYAFPQIQGFSDYFSDSIDQLATKLLGLDFTQMLGAMSVLEKAFTSFANKMNSTKFTPAQLTSAFTKLDATLIALNVTIAALPADIAAAINGSNPGPSLAPLLAPLLKGIQDLIIKLGNQPNNSQSAFNLGTLKGTFLTAIYGQLIYSLNSIRENIDDLDSTLRGFNTDTEKFTSFLGDSLDGLRGYTIENLQNAASLYSDGFRGNNAGLLQVANRLQLTNQNFQSLLKQIPSLALTLRMTSNEMNDFARSVDNTAKKYGVSTEDLINQLKKVEILNIAGSFDAGKQFAKNLTELTAKFGFAKEPIADFINAVYKDYDTVVALGGANLVRKLETASNPEQFRNAVTKLADLMAKGANTFVGQAETAGQGGLSLFKTLQESSEVFGKVAFEGLRVSDSMKNFPSTDKIAEQNQKYAESLNALVKEFKSAFIPIFTKFLHIIRDLVKPLTDFLNTPFGSLTIAVAASIKILFSLNSAIVTLKSSILSAAVAQGAAKNTLGVMGSLGFLAGRGVKFIAANPVATIALGIGTAFLSYKFFQSTESNTARTADGVEEMIDVMSEESDPTSVYQSIFSEMNRDLMFLVSNLTTKTEAGRIYAEQNLAALERLIRVSTDIRDGGSTAPDTRAMR